MPQIPKMNAKTSLPKAMPKILSNVKSEDEPKPTNSMDKILQDLVNQMFMMYFKVHKYHWNVTGPQFFELHEMFGEMYDDIWSNIDKTAEYIRILGKMTDISVGGQVGSASTPDAMIKDILKSNKGMLDALYAAEEAAEYYDHCDMANFMADRIDQHNKYNWMLTAFGGK